MGRLAVAGLAAIAVILVLVLAIFVGRDRFAGMFQSRDQIPTVMILTSHVLETAAEIKMRQGQESPETALSGQIEQKVNGSAKTAAKPGEQDPKTAKSPAQDPAKDEASKLRNQSEGFSLAVAAMQESLDGKVSQQFDNSRRFTLVSAARITEALTAYARESKRSPQSLFQYLSGGVGGASAQAPRPNAKGEAVQQATSTREESANLTEGISAISRKVKADYTLIVTIGEPRFAYDILPAGNGMPARIVMVAQPEVNCEIIDSRTSKGRAYRFANQLARPITETVVIDPQTPLKSQILIKLTRLDDRISDAAAAQVLALVLDKVAPARVVAAGTRVVINRGTNDGVRDGAIYNVKREVGETIREDSTGADLGRSLVDAGSIVVQSSEAAKATVTTATGGPFLKGDVVVMAPPVSPVDRGRAPDQAAQAQPGGVPNLAVDHIRLNGAESASLGTTVSNALANEPKIAVLPRAEMENLRSEAAHNSQASGEFGMTAEEGMRRSGYLVSGDCSTSSRRRTNSVSIGGVTETTSTSTSASASCSLRALSVDGRLLGSAQGSGGGADAAAQAASRALLVRILPAMGVTPSAPEPTPQAAREPAPSPAPTPTARRAKPKPRPRPEPQDAGIHF